MPSNACVHGPPRPAGVCIRAGITDGSIRHLDPQSTAIILWASGNGIISLAWRHDDLQQSPEKLAVLVERAADLVSYGLRLK